MTITVEQMVSREVHYCVSHLIATLGRADYCADDSDEMYGLKEQGLELIIPIDDWEEAASQEGWYRGRRTGIFQNKKSDETYPLAGDWEELCRRENIEPYQREVFEHWLVSNWLGEKLHTAGEKVDMDFAGITVWARTTTGQGIAQDEVIQRIHADLIK